MIAFASLLFLAQAAVNDLHARVEAQPAAVRDFIVRRAGCNDWLGEYPYDADRRHEIERAVRKLRCEALDEDETALRGRHADSPALLAILEETRDMLAW